MADCRILILTALLPEARAIAKKLRLKKVPAPLSLWIDNDVALAVVGMRCQRLPEVLQIPSIARPAGIVMAGLAGGLASELQRGALVADGKGLPGSVINAGVRVGRIHTSDGIVSTPAAKAKLLSDTGCIAVDMETAIARQFALKHAAAFVTLRTISDTVRDTLDPALLALIDDEGRLRSGNLLRLLLRTPAKLPRLLSLQRTTSMALAKLSDVLVKLVASNWPGSTKRHGAS